MNYLKRLFFLQLICLFVLSMGGCSDDSSDEPKDFIKVKEYWLTGRWELAGDFGMMKEFSININGTSGVNNAYICYRTKDAPETLYTSKADLALGYLHASDFDTDDEEADFLALDFFHNDDFLMYDIWIKSVTYDGKLTMTARICKFDTTNWTDKKAIGDITLIHDKN